MPVGALLETVKLKSVVPEPGAAMEVGLKLYVTPEGTPDAVKLIAELKPPETEVVTTPYPLCPWSRYPEVGEIETVNVPAEVPVTVRETLVLTTVLPDVPVTMIE